MGFRFVPDAPSTWLVYDLGSVVLSLPIEFRAVADAVAATPRPGAAVVLAALEASRIAAEAPFAVVESDGSGLRVALRGPATVAAGADSVTGLGATSVLERRIPGVVTARLSVPGGEWTLTFEAVPAPTANTREVLAPSQEVTAIPDAESEVLPVPAPPSLGLLAPTDGDDDRTVVVGDLTPASPVKALSLELPDGRREPLDVAVVIGRAPAVSLEAGPSRVVRIDADDDMSRTHARVAAEGGTAVVTDLGSRNGTVVRIPGRAPQSLRSGEPTPVLVGTVIDFGGGVEVLVREE